MDCAIIWKMKMESNGGYGNSIYWVMSIFSNRMHCALVDRKPIKLMEIPAWRILWHGVPGRQMRRLIRLSAWCTASCAWAPGAPPDAWSSAKSPTLDINLKHCRQKIIESIVHSCIALFKINMHELFILLLTLFLIYLIEFLNKTPLIYLINIVIIIFFLNFLDFAYYMIH